MGKVSQQRALPVVPSEEKKEKGGKMQAAPPFQLKSEAAPVQKQDGKEPKINWGANADSSKVKASALGVIKDILKAAGEPDCTITSTARSPEDQARAMYNNIVKYGVSHQKDLYGPYGDQVIDQYAASKKAGKNAAGIKADMAAKIREVGPANVSKHCADFEVLCVVDIGPSSIGNKKKFIEAVEAEGRVSNFLQPPADPAYHLEIPV